jgi:hypothetical protein
MVIRIDFFDKRRSGTQNKEELPPLKAGEQLPLPDAIVN